MPNLKLDITLQYI